MALRTLALCVITTNKRKTKRNVRGKLRIKKKLQEKIALDGKNSRSLRFKDTSAP